MSCDKNNGIKNILFVCTGNTCRSSMAEGFLREMLAVHPELGAKFTVSSAGTGAYNGDSASQYSISVLKENWNIDISKHCARMITEGDIHKAYIILTMTRAHKEAVISRFAGAIDKIFTLKEYIALDASDASIKTHDPSLDIMDPFGMPYEVYRRCGDEIKKVVEKLASKLINDV